MLRSEVDFRSCSDDGRRECVRCNRHYLRALASDTLVGLRRISV